MTITRVGIDIAINVFQVHGVDIAKRVVWSQQLKRNRFVRALILKLEPGCEIGMSDGKRDPEMHQSMIGTLA